MCLDSATTEGRETVHRQQVSRPAQTSCVCGAGNRPSTVLLALCRRTLVRLCSLWRRFLRRACLAVSSVLGPSVAPPPLPSVVFSASADPCSVWEMDLLALRVSSAAAGARNDKLCWSGDARTHR